MRELIVVVDSSVLVVLVSPFVVGVEVDTVDSIFPVGVTVGIDVVCCTVEEDIVVDVSWLFKGR